MLKVVPLETKAYYQKSSYANDSMVASINDSSPYEVVKAAFCHAVKEHCLPAEEPDEKEDASSPKDPTTHATASLTEREANRRLAATSRGYTPPPWVGRR